MSFVLTFLCWIVSRSDFCSNIYFDESTGILEFPIEIYISGLYSEHPPPLIVTVIALVTSCVLSLKPNYIDFGQVSTSETVTTELEITNHSMGTHEYSFINLPDVCKLLFSVIIKFIYLWIIKNIL